VAAAICTYLIGYRFYSAWICAKVLVLDETRATPAERFNNGRDFIPTNKWVTFGHHFAAIAGPGPLIGPTLAMQFGYLPGTLWILAGSVLGGCVQDMVIMFCSVRRDGRSLGQMARDELGPVGGWAAMIGTMLIMLILIAVLGLVIVNAMKHSPWATATVLGTIPVAMLIGIYMRGIRPGRVTRRLADRHRAVAGMRCRRRLGRSQRIHPRPIRLERRVGRLVRHDLRLCGGHSAGLAAARATRLSVHVPEARRRVHAGGFDPDPRAGHEDAGVYAVRGQRTRSDLQGQPVPVRVHHHRLRRDSPAFTRWSPPARHRSCCRTNATSA